MENLKKEEVNVSKIYGNLCTMTKDDFIKKYNISNNGLTNEQANERLQKYGLNEVTSAKPKKWYNYFFESLLSPFNCILLCVVLVLFYTDVYLADIPNYASIVVIVVWY